MDDSPKSCAHALQFGCPRCGHPNSDDLEFLDVGTPSEWRCGHCERIFSVLLTECEHCASETVAVAMVAAELPSSSASPFTASPCPACGRTPVSHEEAETTIFMA